MHNRIPYGKNQNKEDFTTLILSGMSNVPLEKICLKGLWKYPWEKALNLMATTQIIHSIRPWSHNLTKQASKGATSVNLVVTKARQLLRITQGNALTQSARKCSIPYQMH